MRARRTLSVPVKPGSVVVVVLVVVVVVAPGSDVVVVVGVVVAGVDGAHDAAAKIQTHNPIAWVREFHS